MATSRAQCKAVGILSEPICNAARLVSLGAVYEEYARPLYRYALALSGRREEAEDVVHDVFLALIKRGGVEKIRNLRAYLFKAARRRTQDLRRQRAVEGHSGDDPSLWWVDPTACEATDCELAIDIERAMGRLPPEQREVVALKVGEGFTFRELGQMLGIPADTAASRYRLALGRMRELLRGGGKDE